MSEAAATEIQRVWANEVEAQGGRFIQAYRQRLQQLIAERDAFWWTRHQDAGWKVRTVLQTVRERGGDVRPGEDSWSPADADRFLSS